MTIKRITLIFYAFTGDSTLCLKTRATMFCDDNFVKS